MNFLELLRYPATFQFIKVRIIKKLYFGKKAFVKVLKKNLNYIDLYN